MDTGYSDVFFGPIAFSSTSLLFAACTASTNGVNFASLLNTALPFFLYLPLSDIPFNIPLIADEIPVFLLVTNSLSAIANVGFNVERVASILVCRPNSIFIIT